MTACAGSREDGAAPAGTVAADFRRAGGYPGGMTVSPTRSVDTPLDEALAWRLLLAVRRLVRAGTALAFPAGIGLDAAGGARLLPPAAPEALLVLDGPAQGRAAAAAEAAAARLLDLHLPLAAAPADRRLILGHLGQSLDGFIATAAGASHYVTGPENIVHLHRLRALSDAVIVGAGTVRHDDPRLTTRHVEGDSPVRVILDPRRRLGPDHAVFRDGAAPTLLVCDARRAGHGDGGPPPGRAELLGVPAGPDGALALGALIDRLAERGLTHLFVEGGGRTVSAFLAAGRLDRLQIAVAPLLIGGGRPGLSVPPAASLAEAIRPPCRIVPMGRDVLFDCDLTG